MGAFKTSLKARGARGGYRAMNRRKVEVKAAFLTSYFMNRPSKYHHNLSPACLQLEQLSPWQTLGDLLCQINQRICRQNIIIICNRPGSSLRNSRDMCWGARAGYQAMTRRNVGVEGAFLTQYSGNLPAKYHYNMSPPRLQLEVLSQLRTLEAVRKGKMRCSGKYKWRRPVSG